MQNTIVKKVRIIKKITLVFLADPGHGWLKVSRKIVKAAGISESISRFSYERGTQVYLEEDCDAPMLIEALVKAGVDVRVREKHTNKQSKIRSYNSYTNPVSCLY